MTTWPKMKWPKFQPLAVKAIIPIRPSSYMRAINSLTRSGFQTVILQTYSSIISLKWSSCQACALFFQSTHPTLPLLSPNWIFIPPSLLGKQFSWAEFIPVGVLISVIKYPKKKYALVIGWKRVYSHETQVQSCNTSANSAHAFKISSILNFCDVFFIYIIDK